MKQTTWVNSNLLFLLNNDKNVRIVVALGYMSRVKQIDSKESDSPIWEYAETDDY